jgi:hypothetical protein
MKIDYTILVTNGWELLSLTEELIGGCQSNNELQSVPVVINTFKFH